MMRLRWKARWSGTLEPPLMHQAIRESAFALSARTLMLRYGRRFSSRKHQNFLGFGGLLKQTWVPSFEFDDISLVG